MSKLFRKTLLIMVLLFGMIAAATSLMSGWLLYTHLTQEFTSKGTAIAKSIADSGVEILLNRDLSTIQAVVDQFVEIQGVGYVFVTDAEGEIVSHTFIPTIPAEIAGLHESRGVRGETAVKDLQIRGLGEYIDISAPILAGVGGAVHVGMDKKIIRNEIWAAVAKQQAVVFAIFVLSLVVAYVLVSRISQPLNQLTQYAQRLATAEFSAPAAMQADIERLALKSKDEVGKLAESTLFMERVLEQVIGNLKDTTEELRVSNVKLEEYSQTLEQKVDERTKELKEKNDELVETLQRLQQMQQQLVTQEKLASLGALTAGIAHEIKNPLNFVNNFSALSVDLTKELQEEIDKQKDKLDADALDNLQAVVGDLQMNAEKINQHGKRADSIVRGMLMHSRGKPGERHPTDLNALLDEYVNLAYHGMRAQDSTFNVTIEKDYDKSIGVMSVVPQDLSRVFLNIVNNACYATHEKKRQAGDGFSPTVSVRTKDLGDKIEVRIRDNGLGMPREVREKIFNPFFTTKPTGQGTGLGLSISYDIIVQEHRGELRVETEEGSFAEFIIVLPKNAA
jgi:signal transduction histidine kinase